MRGAVETSLHSDVVRQVLGTIPRGGPARPDASGMHPGGASQGHARRRPVLAKACRVMGTLEGVHAGSVAPREGANALGVHDAEHSCGRPSARASDRGRNGLEE